MGGDGLLVSQGCSWYIKQCGIVLADADLRDSLTRNLNSISNDVSVTRYCVAPRNCNELHIQKSKFKNICS